jgi:hypothetical protein
VLLIPYNLAHSVSVDLPQRPDATPTWSFQEESGGVLSSGTVTLDSVNTTLSGAAAAGASTLSVTSATGITVGRRYLVGGHEDAGGEQITVRAISGTTITPARPLYAAKASGAAFQTTRITAAISATTSVGRDRRLVITWAVSSTSQPPYVVPAVVARYHPHTALTLDWLSDLDPIARKRFPAGLWFPALRDAAWEMLLAHVASRLDPGAAVGTVQLTTAHGYLVRALLLETAGPDYATDYERAMQRYQAERDAALTLIGIDNDQDGVVEEHEGFFKTIPLVRG